MSGGKYYIILLSSPPAGRTQPDAIMVLFNVKMGQCQIIIVNFKFTFIYFIFLLSVNVATVCYIPDI